MASKRQIAANRRNGLRSSGPRSSAGKRHSSANALRHGLSRAIGAGADPEMEALAHLLVGENADEERLAHARHVAAEIRYLKSLPLDRTLRSRQRLDPAATLPLDRDERAAETVRRLLPDLRKLDRYERRAFKAKQEALRKLAEVVKF